MLVFGVGIGRQHKEFQVSLARQRGRHSGFPFVGRCIVSPILKQNFGHCHIPTPSGAMKGRRVVTTAAVRVPSISEQIVDEAGISLECGIM